MKKIFFTAAAIFIVLAVFACASIDLTTDSVSSNAQSSRRPLADHQQEGKIVIYTSIYAEVGYVIETALANHFPNCQIEFSYGGTGTIQALIEQQMTSGGRLGCDMLLIAEPSYSMELKGKGLLHPYVSSEASNLAFDYDSEGYWYPVRISNMVLAFNPDRTPRNSIPETFYAFAYDPRFRGVISMTNPIISGTSLASITALRDKFGYAYFEALGRQNISIDSSSVALQKLQAGEYSMVMVLEETVLRLREEEGSRLEVIYPSDGTIVIPSTIMIINDRWNAGGNIKTAQAIADWFLSEEGQEAVVLGWMHSVRNNFNKIPSNSIPTERIIQNSIRVNWQNLNNERDEIRTRFEETVMYSTR